jgi:thiamine-phosphate pyrophosphorylase
MDFGLYVITEAWGGRGHLEVARAGLAGGAKAVQLRAKDATTRELMDLGRAILAACRQAGAAFLVNDRLDVALALGADGVHLGPDDMPVADARRVADAVQPGLVIGASAGTVEEALAAERAGADYLGVGSIFGTDTKPDAGAPVGVARIREIRAATRLPIIAIGGVTAENVAQVIEAGAAGAAVISAISRADDMAAAAAAIASAMGQGRTS